jgi:hypothetical protein
MPASVVRSLQRGYTLAVTRSATSAIASENAWAPTPSHDMPPERAEKGGTVTRHMSQRARPRAARCQHVGLV